MNMNPVFNYFARVKAENSADDLIYRYISTFSIYVNKHLLN